MDIEMLRKYALVKKGVTEGLPFGEDVLVFKVGGKMFLLMNLVSDPLQISLKTHPDKSIVLREKYPQITPGYHLNKKHWNTLKLDGFLSGQLVSSLLDESYQLVLQSLPKKVQNNILSQ